MRQAVHIFLKDSRQFRVPIAIVLLWTAFYGFAGTYPESADEMPRMAYVLLQLSDFVLPVAWWFVISQAFHADALPGDRQFWLTRPFHRGSLFAAKALFIVAYVTVPMTLAMATVLLAHGFPLVAATPGIAWAQILILALVVLPAAALASLTSTLTQFVVAAFVLPVLFLGSRGLSAWGALDWIRSGVAVIVIVAIAAAVLFWQFSRRRIRQSRLIALVGVLALVATLPLLSWRTAFALQSRLTPHWDGPLAIELVRPAASSAPAPAELGPLRLVFRASGPPADTPITCEAGDFVVEGANNTIWTANVLKRPTNARSSVVDGCSFHLQMPEEFVKQVANGNVSIRAQLYLTVFGPAASTPLALGQSSVLVPHVGVCSAERRDYPEARPGGLPRSFTRVGCDTAFRIPRHLIDVSSGEQHAGWTSTVSYSPFPAELRLGPPTHTMSHLALADSVSFSTREPVAHVRIAVEAKGIRLLDFY